jgi:Tfp pilus assembly protein PilO
MNLNKRERTILWMTLTVVGLLLADRVVISPVLEYRQALSDEVDQLTDQVNHDQRLLRTGRTELKKWNQMKQIGLPASSSEAESRTLGAINDWAGDAKLSLVSVKPEYRRSDETLVPVVFRVSANGSMKSIAKFIWHVETAGIPVCVDTLQINTRDKNKDNLALQMGVSALFRQADKKEVKP